MRYQYKDISKSFKKGGSITSRLFMNYVSVPFIYFFSNFTKVTPNQITSLGFFFGLIASFCFLIDQFVIGVLFFELSYIFDCVDGRLARLTNRTSKIGDMFDHILGQFLVLILIIPLIYKFYLLDMSYKLLLLVVFSFLSPFNYFVNYFSKYTFSKVYSNSLIKDNSTEKNNSLLKRIHLFLKGKGMKSIPSDVEAIHFVFVIVPLLLFYNYYELATLFIVLAIMIFLLEIIITIYRNIHLNKLY